MPKLDIAAINPRKGSGYPTPFAELAKNRIKRALGDAGGLTDFGVNLSPCRRATGPVSVIGIPWRMNWFMSSLASWC
jgi:hypothetical protein